MEYLLLNFLQACRVCCVKYENQANNESDKYCEQWNPMKDSHTDATFFGFSKPINSRQKKKQRKKPTSVTGNSTVCFAAGLIVISVTVSDFPNSPSLLSPPYFTGSCSGAMYLKVQKEYPKSKYKINQTENKR